MPGSVPNLPQPINGMIRTFDNSERTFSRPYSAKTIFFYKIGDEHFRGIRIPVSKARYRTMEALLDDLNEKVPMQFGVRRLFTPRGRAEVTSLEDLQHMGRYVCSSSKWAAKKYATVAEKYVDKYGANSSEHSYPSSYSTARSNEQQHLSSKPETKNTFTSFGNALIHNKNQKQIAFILNGMPSKTCRMQIKTNKQNLTFDQVLNYVSECLQAPIAKLFTKDGTGIFSFEDLINGSSPFVACQRHERLISWENGFKLPLIKNNGNQLPPKTKHANSSHAIDAPNFSLPPLSPSRKRIKKQIRTRTVSRKRRPRLKNIDEVKANVGQASIFAPEADDANLQASVLKIQTSLRGFLARKLAQDMRQQKIAAAKGKIHVSEIQQNHVFRRISSDNGENLNIKSFVAKKSQNSRQGSLEEDKKLQKNVKSRRASVHASNLNEKSQKVSFKYSISIFTGNRWAADTEADLHIILVGDLGQTEKLWLKQQGDEPKFLQNQYLLQVDTFEVQTDVRTGYLRKIICGHENEGYGAGIFIDRIVVNEIEENHHFQYVFLCSKWFDSGQVDGKIERSIQCSGYYNLKHLPLQNENPDFYAHSDEAESEHIYISSKSRYRLTLNCGKIVAAPDQHTNVNIVCHGNFTNSDPYCIWPNLSVIDEKTSKSFDLDCGNVGELYKIRFESENPSVSWQLDGILLKDVDTGEESQLNCNKWLCKLPPPGVKLIFFQTFREIPIIRIGLEPLPVYQYTLYVKLSSNFRFAKSPCHVNVQLRGEFGDSGTHSALLMAHEKDSMTDSMTSEFGLDCRIVLEAVSLGRLTQVIFDVPAEEPAIWLAEGYSALNALYAQQNLSQDTIQSGHSWIIDQVNVRESTHAPYLFIMKDCKYLQCEESGIIKKAFLFSDMQGLSTKLKEKNLQTNRLRTTTKRDGKWRVTVVTGQHPEAGTESTLFLMVYGEKGKSPPIPLLDKSQTFKSGSKCNFEVDLGDIGRIFKIRIRLDFQGPKPMWYLRRIKMKEIATGDELRFPVEMWLERTEDNPEIATELPAVWPDVPPIPSISYQIKLKTSLESKNETDFDVSVVVFGERGDSGRRFLISALGTASDSCFKPGNIDTFEFEAVSVGKIEKIFVALEPKKPLASWYLSQAEIYDSGNDLLYTFLCEKFFSDEENGLEHEFSPTSVISYEG